MMRNRLILVAAVSFGLVGCTVRPGSLVSLPTTVSGVSEAGADHGTTTVTDGQPVSEYGSLQLTIRWPERPSGYQTALIPTTTNSLVIKVASGSTIVGQTTVTRVGSETTATANLPLKADNNLSVEVKAYHESAPVPNGAVPIALGTAVVNITRSKKTTSSVSLTPLFVPTITGLSRNAGVTGDEVTITGTNFGTGSVPVFVYFNDVLTVGATRSSETSLTVQVPPGAPTGKVVVKADGVISTSNVVFWVPQTLSISASKGYWDPSGNNSQIVILGKQLQVTPSVFWEAKIGDAMYTYGTAPSPTWNSSNQTAGTVDASGLFTAADSYVPAGTNVTASFGSKISDPIKFIPESVTVSAQPIEATPTLGGKGLPSLRIAAMNTFSDGATNSFVNFSAEASASVDVTGKVTATDFGSNGTITVSAESPADSTKKATIQVTLSNYVVSTYAGTGALGSSDGTLSASKFRHPFGMAFDQAGNMYVADSENGVIRRISGGSVSTLPLGIAGFHPYGVAYYRDTANNMDWLYVSDDANHKVYRIELTSGGTSGNAVVLAGSGSAGYTDGAGAAAQFNAPKGVVVDATRNVYVADDNNHCIRKIDAAGMVTTFAGSPFGYATPFNRDGQGSDPATGPKFVHPTGLTKDGNGHMYVTQVNDGHIRHIEPTGMVDTRSLNRALWNPMDIAVDPQGVLFVTENSEGRVYKITPQGEVFPIAGSGGNQLIPSLKDGVGTNADLRAPYGIVRASDGSLYVTEYTNNVIRKIQ